MSEADEEVRRVIGLVKTWQAHFKAVGVSCSDIANLAQSIDGEFLLSQRVALH